jgi:hypothetical protein
MNKPRPALRRMTGCLAAAAVLVAGCTYWEQSVDGKSTAVMEDCTDTSQSGSMFAATGERRTVGVPDNNTRATFVKGPDGVWRVKEIFFFVDLTC